MKRITVDEVKEAYAKTGLVPIRDSFLEFGTDNAPGTWCGCPMTAAFAVRFQKHPFGSFLDAAKHKCRTADDDGEFDQSDIEDLIDEYEDCYRYRMGFVRMIDAPEEDIDWFLAYTTDSLDKETLQGQIDGKAVREAIFPDA